MTETTTAPAQKRGHTAVDERIYRAVVNAVMSHRLPPGTRLGEAEFCDLYGVSRTTVRKALQRLAHDHIIELRPNRGAVVASPSPKEARDVFAARRALEREIVPLVVQRATPASLRAIRAAESNLFVTTPALLQRALRDAGDDPLAMAPTGDWSMLTGRQREIMRWAGQGLSTKQIARQLGISPETVKTHLHHVFQRGGVHGRMAFLAHHQDVPAPPPG